MKIMKRPLTTFGILEGRDYRYHGQFPPECQGASYHCHRFILDVPSYQWKLLMEALDGPDAGLWFTCTPANFWYAMT